MFAQAISKLSKPGLLGRVRRKLLRRKGRAPGANYLDSYGWARSNMEARPVDQDGNPLPWMTYPAISVLSKIASPSHRVFEYGCGHSSLWWAVRSQSVISVEHDIAWAGEISRRAPPNLTVLPRPQRVNELSHALVSQFHSENPDLPSSGANGLDIEHGLECSTFSAYAVEITNHSPFDIIIVDGMARSLCAWLAARCLKSDGIIVFDNSERWQYNPGFRALGNSGFGRIDFHGLGPCNSHPWCTSIFFRNTKWSEPLLTRDPSVKSGLDWVIQQTVETHST